MIYKRSYRNYLIEMGDTIKSPDYRNSLVIDLFENPMSFGYDMVDNSMDEIFEKVYDLISSYTPVMTYSQFIEIERDSKIDSIIN